MQKMFANPQLVGLVQSGNHSNKLPFIHSCKPVLVWQPLTRLRNRIGTAARSGVEGKYVLQSVVLALYLGHDVSQKLSLLLTAKNTNPFNMIPVLTSSNLILCGFNQPRYPACVLLQ